MNIRIRLLMTIITAFFLGRVSFWGSDFILPVALLTVALSIDSIYIYLLPIFWLAMASCESSMLFWGDFAAMIISSLIITFIGRKRLALAHRILISACVYGGCTATFLFIGNKAYLFSPGALVKEELLLIFLIIIMEKGIRGLLKRDMETKLYALVPLAVLAISSVANMMTTMVFMAIIFIALGMFESLEDICFASITTGILVFCRYNGAISPMNILMVLTLGILWAAVYRLLADYFWKTSMPSNGVILKGILIIKRNQSKIKRSLGIKNISEKDRIETVLLENIKNYGVLGKYYRDLGGQRQIFSFQLKAMEKALMKIWQEINTDLEKSENKCNVKFGYENYASLDKCGDSMLCKNLKEGKSLMLISDGMGKGEDAARESQLVINTLEKMIECGVEPALALKSINTIMMNNQEGTFATVDMAVIHKEQGYLEIFKMGASTTYIKRREKIHAVNFPSLPAGIDKVEDIQGTRVKIKNGDVIVMVSDGIIDSDRGDEEGLWIKEKLETIRTKDPYAIAQILMNKSIEKYGIKERDDLTVLVGYVV